MNARDVAKVLRRLLKMDEEVFQVPSEPGAVCVETTFAALDGIEAYLRSQTHTTCAERLHDVIAMMKLQGLPPAEYIRQRTRPFVKDSVLPVVDELEKPRDGIRLVIRWRIGRGASRLCG